MCYTASRGLVQLFTMYLLRSTLQLFLSTPELPISRVCTPGQPCPALDMLLTLPFTVRLKFHIFRKTSRRRPSRPDTCNLKTILVYDRPGAFCTSSISKKQPLCIVQIVLSDNTDIPTDSTDCGGGCRREHHRGFA